MIQHSIKITLLITSNALNLLVWSWCLCLTLTAILAWLSLSGIQSVLFGLYLLLSWPASFRNMTSSFKRHLLSCRWDQLETNGEGELCESCGNSCQRQLIKHTFISCGVTSINRDAPKCHLEGEINHFLGRQGTWTCVCIHAENSNC